MSSSWDMGKSYLMDSDNFTILDIDKDNQLRGKSMCPYSCINVLIQK